MVGKVGRKNAAGRKQAGRYVYSTGRCGRWYGEATQPSVPLSTCQNHMEERSQQKSFCYSRRAQKVRRHGAVGWGNGEVVALQILPSNSILSHQEV